jgi:hypothetical protein
MSNASSQLLEFNPKEPIPGYTTTELIGRGGSGEVWRAVAPGGLAKAVKIVYGDIDAERTRVELKSLARIKDVRHPLLLSIERIEITGANLVIVTELADCSLKDYFAKKTRANAVGVPPEELLRYLSDAAEALDFLYAQYSLQHLDVKPENILLLAGRAKVGDFGLVKNLYERATSIVGGLTPTYSPPEVFEGKPTRHSDQYSLAIVYMQMLSGALPFNGSNAAQLAAQHLRSAPDLSALPRRQRPVIARALSKDPAQRFENCVAMMEALKAGANDSAIPAPAHTVNDPPVGRASDRLPRMARPPATPGETPSRSSERRAAGESRRARCEGPSRETRAAEGGTRPAIDAPPLVIVGIGGTAVHVLGKLVDRLHDRIGDESQWSAIQVVLVDSDARALTARSDSEGSYLQVVPIRLRRAETFGARAGEILQWLSRRWFYGIPRDLTTAHYRPLGRLALVTHAARVREVLHVAISAAAERLRAMAPPEQTAGQPIPTAPRVMVIGSIGGGTAGGAILDVAYAVRSELNRQGLSDDDVHGVLLHSTPRGNAERDKSLANAYATLSELYHYSRPGSHFPGEASLGAPPFHGDNATFARTHVLDLGSGLSEREWDLAAEKAAEFLYCSTLTPARVVLDDWHKSDRRLMGDAAAQLPLWCCDVLAFGAGTTRLVSQIARRTCVDVVSLWREGLDATPEEQGTTGATALMTVFAARNSARSAKVEATVKQKLAECNLIVEHFFQEADEVIKLEAGYDKQEYVRRLVEEALTMKSEGWKEQTDRLEAIVEVIDQILHCNAGDDQAETSCSSLYDRIVARLAVRGSGQATRLLDWIRAMVDTPAIRVEGARQHAAAARLLLQEIHERLVIQAAAQRQSALALGFEARGTEGPRGERLLRKAWTARKNGQREPLREILTSYASARLNEVLHLAVVKQIRMIEAEIATLLYQLDSLSRNLGLLKDRLQESDDPVSGAEEESHTPDAVAEARYHQLIVKQLDCRRRDIAANVDQALDRQLFHGGPGLRRFLEPDSELWKTLSGPLSDASRQAVLNCLKETICRLMEGPAASSNGGSREDIVHVILQGLGSDGSRTATGAGDRVLIVPADVDASALREKLGPAAGNLAIVNGCTCDVALCTVRRDVSLEQFATEIIGGMDVFRELASRLHTRIDVQWSPILEQKSRPREEAPPLAAAAEANPTAIIALPRPTPVGSRTVVDVSADNT